jgi:hypothetical protein
MTPAGQNYPIHDHTFLFWGLYLGVIVTVTIALLGLFLLMVHRSSQSTRTAGGGAPTEAPRDEAPTIEHAPVA